MKLVVLLLLLLPSAGISSAQVSGGGTVAPVPPTAPVTAYGPSMSVIDRNGHLLIFDVNYDYRTPGPRTPRVLTRIPASKTRLIVVRNNGRRDAAKEFEGTIQVVGAGYYAVYVVLTRTINSTSGDTPGTNFTTRRQLMAINVDSTSQPAPLDVPLFTEVKLSASADTQHLDTLSLVDPPVNPRILAPAVRRFARLITCDGKAFNSTDPVPLP